MADPRGASAQAVPDRLSPPARTRLRHTAHYYLALAGLAGGAASCVLNLWAYYDEGLILTGIAFAVVVLTAAVLFATWFWGAFLLMSGRMVRRHLVLLIVHATLGSIAPLVYMIAIGFQMDTLGSQPVGGSEVALEFLGLLILLVQIGIGRLMVRPGLLSPGAA